VFEIERVVVKLEREGRDPDTFAIAAEVVLSDENALTGNEVLWTAEWGPEHIWPNDPIRSADSYDEVRERFVRGLMDDLALQMSDDTGEVFEASALMRRVIVEWCLQ
jgi:hypothetical protein